MCIWEKSFVIELSSVVQSSSFVTKSPKQCGEHSPSALVLWLTSGLCCLALCPIRMHKGFRRSFRLKVNFGFYVVSVQLSLLRNPLTNYKRVFLQLDSKSSSRKDNWRIKSGVLVEFSMVVLL